MVKREVLKFTTLDQVQRNASAIITSHAAQDQTLSQRLNSLGIVAGTEVKVLQRAPFGGPISVRVMGSTLSLRRSEASLIAVELA